MARVPAQQDEPKIGPAIAKHIRALGLPNWREYQRWCREMRLDPSLEKSVADREDEIEALARKLSLIHI